MNALRHSCIGVPPLATPARENMGTSRRAGGRDCSRRPSRCCSRRPSRCCSRRPSRCCSGPRALLESPSPSSGGTIVGVRLARREQRASIPRPVPFKGSAPRIRITTRFADGIGGAPAGLPDKIRTGLSTATVVPPANFLVPRECAATCTSCRALTIAKVGFKLVRFDDVVEQVLASEKVVTGQYDRGERCKQQDVVHCRHRNRAGSVAPKLKGWTMLTRSAGWNSST